MNKKYLKFGGIMQKTGIIRKVDDLGRIVIPKELRKNLKIREGDLLEISLAENNKIILEKYEPLGEEFKVFSKYLEVMAKNTNNTCILTDTEKVIFSFGPNSNLYKDKKLKNSFIDEIFKRSISMHYNKVYTIVEDEDIRKISNEKIAIINVDGSVIGAIIMLTNNYAKKFGDLEEKLLDQAVDFFTIQMEI